MGSEDIHLTDIASSIATMYTEMVIQLRPLHTRHLLTAGTLLPIGFINACYVLLAEAV